MYSRPTKTIRHLVKSNKVFFVGLFTLVAAIAMLLVVWHPLTVMSECEFPRGPVSPPGQGKFLPASSFSMPCHYREDLGQDLIFWARIVANADPIKVPSHVEIRDTSNNIIASQQFNSSTVVLYIKPESFGVYNATITNLEPVGTTYPVGTNIFISYGFGHLAGKTYPGVHNPLGEAYKAMAFWGYFLITPGVILIIVAVVRGLVRGAERRFKQNQE